MFGYINVPKSLVRTDKYGTEGKAQILVTKVRLLPCAK